MSLRVFICTDHDCYWPVGVASVVVAEDEEGARALLDAALVGRNGPKGGLQPHAESPYTLQELDVTRPGAQILLDGDY